MQTDKDPHCETMEDQEKDQIANDPEASPSGGLANDNEKEADDEIMDSDEFSDDEEMFEEMDDSEIDSMLEEGFPKSKRLHKQRTGEDDRSKLSGDGEEHTSKELIIKKITVLEEKAGNTFEVLPGGWIKVRHSSGLPLYLHRKTRVCTLAKPYFLGAASVRRHSIPVSGIPCLAYRRALDKEEKDKELMEKQAQELEMQPAEDPATTEKPETINVLTKCLNATTGKDRAKKCPVINSEVLVEKMKQLKRKLEIESQTEESVKPKKIAKRNAADESLQTLTSQDGESEALELSSGEPCSNSADSESNSKTEVITDEVTQDDKDGAASAGRNLGGSISKRPDENDPATRALIPLAKVETAKENASLYSVSPLDLREYCKSLFNFAEVECKRFKTWSARRRHTKEQKRKQLERPTLPDNAQVIKFFDLSAWKNGDGQFLVKKFNDYIFNPNGKSSVCILHEFVQHALRKQPTYSFQELENAATPYSATVMINEIPYGRGFGSSKKTAKAEAAKATLEILIPQMKGKLNGSKSDPNSDFDITEVSSSLPYFQQVEMNDVRIPKMCTSVSEPSPYTLLLTCLQRNFGQSESSSVKFEMIATDPSKGNPPNQFKMTAGSHSVVVTASNKREGKQLASQLLLSQIHPHITNFGAFIKMYGNGSIKSVKEKKQEEQQITTLQSKASANSPNWAILEKLKQEMLKLAGQEKDSKDLKNDGGQENATFPATNDDSDGNSSQKSNITQNALS